MAEGLSFDRFVAVDWSGARGERHRGIAVAVAEPGVACPRIVAPPHPRGWARAEVAEWLLALPGRVLAGFDFSFAPPFLDRGAYLPGLDTPETAPAFWAWLDGETQDAHLGVAGFLAGTARPHFWMGAADGPKAHFLRWRQCELAFNATGGGKPSTVFDCVGAAQVARASFSGMRLLHRVGGPFAIWPFDPPGQRTLVEIYTRAFLRLAGGRGGKLRDRPALDTALAALGSRPWPGDWPLSDHATDVLVAAAALRTHDPAWWTPAALSPPIARTEGWTFGVA
jgi:hypothetical protein